MKNRIRNKIEVSLNRLPKTCKNFVEDTIQYANSKGYKVKLLNKKYEFIGSLPVGGYFDEESKEIAVACRGKPIERWIGTLAHEGCHLDQWVQDKKRWDVGSFIGELDEWFEHEAELSLKKIKRCIKEVQALEHDCETRTIEKILCYDLPIDVDRYAQQANTYVWFYTIAGRKRKWFKKGFAPYMIPSIYNKMPKYIMPLDAYDVVPKPIMKAYEKIF